MRPPSLLRRAIFLGAVMLGVSFAARATPPCPISEELLFTVETARIDGADQDIKEIPVGALYLFPQNDESTDVFLAGTYDPDTGEARSLELRRAP
jgi:hypothetical protein